MKSTWKVNVIPLNYTRLLISYILLPFYIKKIIKPFYKYKNLTKKTEIKLNSIFIIIIKKKANIY